MQDWDNSRASAMELQQSGATPNINKQYCVLQSNNWDKTSIALHITKAWWRKKKTTSHHTHKKIPGWALLSVCYQYAQINYMIWWVGVDYFHTIQYYINSLWPSDTIWRQRSGSTLAQVMACCLTAPSHYLHQCWLIIGKVQSHPA